MLRTVFGLVMIALSAVAQESAPTSPLSHGPRATGLTGHGAIVWARAHAVGHFRVIVTSADDRRQIFSSGVVTSPASDFTIIQRVSTGLSPGERYRARIVATDEKFSGNVWDFPEGAPMVEFQSPPPTDQPSRVSIVVGSCASHRAEPENPSWASIEKSRPDALLLIGDTPYIDSTKLDVQFARYREFFAHGGLPSLMAKVPTFGLWDDHDFGQNDSDGRLEGKENSATAFRAYYPTNEFLREKRGGTYSSIRIGGIEFFMLDARWFAKTEPSPFDPAKPTLLGKKQWEWLKAKLSQSTAPFKALVSGMVWDDVVRPNKPDYWGAYPHERKALFDFIAKEKIEGVFLVGGDIHRSRFVKFPPEKTGVPYTIYEVISSPLAQSTIEQGDPKDPSIVVDLAENHMWAEIVADTTKTPARLSLRIMTAEKGQRAEMELSTRDLRP